MRRCEQSLAYALLQQGALNPAIMYKYRCAAGLGIQVPVVRFFLLAPQSISVVVFYEDSKPGCMYSQYVVVCDMSKMHHLFR